MTRFKQYAFLASTLVFLAPTVLAGSLPQLFMVALRSNPQILKSNADKHAAYQGFRLERARFYPQISASYSAGIDSHKSATVRQNSRFTQQKSLTAQQLIFDGGKTINRIRSAEFAFKETEALRFDTINEIALRLSDAYVSAIRFRTQVALASRNVHSHLTTLQDMRHRFKQGAGKKSELSLARARLALARARLYQNRGNYNNALYQLEQIVGRPVRKFISPQLPGQSDLPKTVKKMVEKALKHHPSIVSMRFKLKSASHTVDERKAEIYMPSLNLQVSGIRNNNAAGVRGLNQNVQSLLVFNYDFLKGGSDVFAYKQSVEEREGVKEGLRDLYRVVNEQVQHEWNDLNIARLRMQALSNHVSATKQTLGYFKEEFKLGKRSLLNVLDSQNELFNSRSQLADATYQMRLDSFELLASSGELPHFLLKQLPPEHRLHES